MANVAALPILLKELHLSAMARQWEALQEETLANHWTLAHYLTVLCENEVAHRHTQRLQRYRTESHLPAAKTLSQFDFGACPQANSTQLAHLAHNAEKAIVKRNHLGGKHKANFIQLGSRPTGQNN